MKKAAVEKAPRNKWFKASAVRIRTVNGQPVIDIRQTAPKRKKANPKKRAVSAAYRAVRKRTSRPKAARRR